MDTGHLMNAIPGIYSEQDGIAALLEIFDGYPADLIDRITAMHFHYSASGRYRENFEEKEYQGGPLPQPQMNCFTSISLLLGSVICSDSNACTTAIFFISLLILRL